MIRIYALTVCFVLAAIAHVHGQTNTIQLRNGSHSTTILPSSSSTVSVQIPSLSAGTHYLLTSTTNPGSSGAAGSFLTYGATSAQNTLDISATGYLFNVGYAATVVEQNALGGLITSTATGAGNMNATALTLSATGSGTGTSDALYISNGRLKFKESNGNFVTTFQAGDQAANINYTLPTADGSSGAILTTNGSGVLSWSTTPSAFSIDNLSDAKYGGTGFDYSMILGHQTTGAISGADAATLNTATGYDALKKITTGDQNTAYGTYSLQEVTSGSWNTAVGAYAGWENSTAEYNTFVGAQAGMTVKIGSNNVGVGFNVMRNATNGGSHNTGVGNQAMQSVNSGNYNVAVGSSAGILVGSGSNNVLIGYNAGDDLTTGSRNVFIGNLVGSNNSLDTEDDLLLIDNSATTTPLVQGDFNANTLTFNAASVTVAGDGTSTGELRLVEPSGSEYTAFKAQAQASNITYKLPATMGTDGQILSLSVSSDGTLAWATDAGGATTLDGLSDAKSGGTGFGNSLILGHQTTGVLVASDGAEFNTATGYAAMQSITTGNSNTATGYRALKDLTTGSYNTAYGQEALRDVQTSSSNTAFGYNSLLRVTSGAANTALGISTGLYLTTGSNNIMVGREAGWGLNTADGNVAIGYGVFRNGEEGSHSSADVGSFNVAIGYSAMYNGPSGADNVGIGRSALTNAFDATLNVALGLNSGTAITSGDNNTLLGVNTGLALVSGSRNVFIGISAGSNTASDASDLLYIDNSNTNTPLIYGDFSGNTLTFNGAITTTGTSALNGNVTVGGGASASEVRFLEPSGSGSNYTAFKAQAQGSNITYTLPATIGTANQVLSLSNTDGTLSWATATSVAAINDLTDAVKGGANFSNSMVLGSEVTTMTAPGAERNTGVGIGAMDAITTGDDNTAVGSSALTSVTDGFLLTAIGSSALANATSAARIVAIGAEAAYSVTTGTYSVFVGNQAGNAFSDGTNVVGIGYGALRNVKGSNNVAIGTEVMSSLTTGTANVALGGYAGVNAGIGSRNVLLGEHAGDDLTSGSGNVIIGYYAGAGNNIDTEDDLLIIDNSSTATPLIEGNFSANTLTFNGATTTTGNVTVQGTAIYSPPGTAKAVTATTNTDGSGSVVTTFTNTYEKVAATATTGAGYIKLPTGTEGQIVYLHITFTASGSNTVTVINSTGTNTAMVFDGTGADEIVAHMLYTTTKGWVVFSALEYDN